MELKEITMDIIKAIDTKLYSYIPDIETLENLKKTFEWRFLEEVLNEVVLTQRYTSLRFEIQQTMDFYRLVFTCEHNLFHY